MDQRRHHPRNPMTIAPALTRWARRPAGCVLCLVQTQRRIKKGNLGRYRDKRERRRANPVCSGAAGLLFSLSRRCHGMFSDYATQGDTFLFVGPLRKLDASTQGSSLRSQQHDSEARPLRWAFVFLGYSHRAVWRSRESLEVRCWIGPARSSSRRLGRVGVGLRRSADRRISRSVATSQPVVQRFAPLQCYISNPQYCHCCAERRHA